MMKHQKKSGVKKPSSGTPAHVMMSFAWVAVMAYLAAATCTFQPSNAEKQPGNMPDTTAHSIPTTDPQLPTPDTRHPTPDTRLPTPDYRLPTTDNRQPAPDNRQPSFTELITIAPTIRIDIRYATTDNFTKSKIYDCGRCYLRPEAARAVARAQKALEQDGLGLKMFDCYRPAPYQQRLWDKAPNPDYVTPPAKGSMHSRGAAVDLTLVDLKTGKELDMGTPYDFFGPEAHTDNNRLPAPVLANRKKLRLAMETVGFQGIRTEWWHFSYREKTYPLSEWVWPCNQ